MSGQVKSSKHWSQYCVSRIKVDLNITFGLASSLYYQLSRSQDITVYSIHLRGVPSLHIIMANCVFVVAHVGMAWYSHSEFTELLWSTFCPKIIITWDMSPARYSLYRHKRYSFTGWRFGSLAIARDSLLTVYSMVSWIFLWYFSIILEDG
jgi:hypothetical protein